MKNAPIIKEQELFAVILKKLKQAKFSVEFPTINYWQAQPTEQNINHLFFRDYEGFFKKDNFQHKVVLPVEFTAVIFGKDAAILGTTILLELIQLIGQNQSWGFQGVFTELSKREKLSETQGVESCQVLLEILITYKTNSFYLE